MVRPKGKKNKNTHFIHLNIHKFTLTNEKGNQSAHIPVSSLNIRRYY